MLTSKHASSHNGVHLFNISTFKSGPNVVCFLHFGIKNQNVLRAKTACAFSTPQLPSVLRHWGVLQIVTSKCASRHNGVQFVISHLARWLRTRHFSEPAFRPSGATNHWKNTSVSRLFYLFPHLHLLSSDSFSSLIFSLLLFSSLILPTSAFSSVHIVGSLTSKLPFHNIYIHVQCIISIIYMTVNIRCLSAPARRDLDWKMQDLNLGA